MKVQALMKASSKTISAIHEDHHRAFLESLGLAAAFDRGDLTCAVCDRPLRDAGIGAARSEADQPRFACAALDCIRELGELRDK
jgi:hypothetical protein